MKCFQILSNFVHWDATNLYSSAALIPENTYAPDIHFVDAPDYVREGWGYDETAEGDARFIEPTPPEGWLYDRETGTFYSEDKYPGWTPEPIPDETDLLLNQLEEAIGNE